MVKAEYIVYLYRFNTSVDFVRPKHFKFGQQL